MLKVEEVSKAVAAGLEGEVQAALDWAQILELVMTIMGGPCFKSKASLRAYKADQRTGDAGIIKKVAALVVIKREAGLRRADALKVRDEFFNTIDILSDEELDQAYDEVIAETMPPKFII